MKVLGIETSCDETSLALYSELKTECRVYSQEETHAPFGGVVPERAARLHEERLPLLYEELVGDAAFDLVAATRGPGLAGALMTGYAFGRGVALAHGVPFVGVNHLEAHLYALFLAVEPKFPYLALLVSGGHTLLVDLPELGQFQILGRTRDDAAGECFDKGARMLGLPFPGGKALAELAASGEEHPIFPRPDPGGLDFSFSGLKTALYLYLQKERKKIERASVAASFQAAIVECLASKVGRALDKTGRSRLIVAGGVAANSALRGALSHLSAEVFFPPPRYCTDNAAMIALCGALYFSTCGETSSDAAVAPRLPIANWERST